MSDIQKFSYGDYVYFNKPMKTYKTYKKYIIDDYLGEYIFSVIVPFYANQIKVLIDIDGARVKRDTKEATNSIKAPSLFFITNEGEFMNVPDQVKYKAGYIIDIHNIERMVMLNQDTSVKVKKKIQEIHKKNLLPSERDRLLNEMLEINESGEARCVAESEGICFRPKDLTEKFSYWYTLATNEKLREKGEIALEDVMVVRNVLSQDISNKLDSVLDTWISKLANLAAYGIKSIPKEEIQEQCAALVSFAETTIEQFNDFVKAQSYIECKQVNMSKVEHDLCKQLSKKLTEYIAQNTNNLTEVTKQAAITILDFLPIPFPIKSLFKKK